MTTYEIASKIFNTPSHPANVYLAKANNKIDSEGVLNLSCSKAEMVEMVTEAEQTIEFKKVMVIAAIMGW